MLPACRIEGDMFAIPQFTLHPRDVEGLMDERHGFPTGFRGCFTRSEPRAHFFHDMVGQFSALDRQSIEPMALPVEGGNGRAMPRCMSDTVWAEAQMWRTYHGLVDEDMGDPEGVVIFDESGFPKQGRDSVGVARQYGGALGKVEHWQVGVCAAYASRHGYALVDKRLFMPEAWCTETSAAKRTKGEVPQDVGFQTTPQRARAMLRELRDEGVLPFKSVVADCLSGHSPEFRQAVDETVGTLYVVSIPVDTRCWLQGPVRPTTPYTSGGERRTKRVVAATAKEPIAVETLAKSLHHCCWDRRNVSEGTQGPIEYEFTQRQVTLCGDGLPVRTVWVVMKRTRGASPSYGYSISNAPVSARLPLFVWLSGLRWAIEQCFEEAKTDLGMDQYEGRQYPGWHHHMRTTR
jgi:SRSO17 transposase